MLDIKAATSMVSLSWVYGPEESTLCAQALLLAKAVGGADRAPDEAGIQALRKEVREERRSGGSQVCPEASSGLGLPGLGSASSYRRY